MKTGIELITKERQEQIDKHGFSVARDRAINHQGDLVRASISVLLLSGSGWLAEWGDITNDVLKGSAEFLERWSPKVYQGVVHKKTELESLILSGALISAETDRRVSMEKLGTYHSSCPKGDRGTP